MKKVFVVVLNYDEKEESMFTDVGVEVTFDNQLYDLHEKGYVGSYSDTLAYEVPEGLHERVMTCVDND